MFGNRTHIALLSCYTQWTTVITRHHAISCFDVFSHMKSEKHQCRAVFGGTQCPRIRESLHVYAAPRHVVYFKRFVPYQY